MPIKKSVVFSLMLIIVIIVLSVLISQNYWLRIKECPLGIFDLGKSALINDFKLITATSNATNVLTTTFLYNYIDVADNPFFPGVLVFTAGPPSCPDTTGITCAITKDINFIVTITGTTIIAIPPSINITCPKSSLLYTDTGMPYISVPATAITNSMNSVLAQITKTTNGTSVITAGYNATPITINISLVPGQTGIPSGTITYSYGIKNYTMPFLQSMPNMILYEYEPEPVLNLVINIKNNLSIKENPYAGILNIYASINYNPQAPIFILIYSGTDFLYDYTNNIISFLPNTTNNMQMILSNITQSARDNNKYINHGNYVGGYTLTFKVLYIINGITLNLYIDLNCKLLSIIDIGDYT